MADIEIALAESPEDIEAIRQLCRDFVAWQRANHPEHRAAIDAYFEPVAFERMLADLPRLHGRPKGALLLGRVDGRPAGCVMSHEIEPGVAEMKRLFVAESARGHGLGRRLVEALMDQARADGHRRMRLDTAFFLATAIALYRRLGFVDRVMVSDIPADARAVAISLGRDL